MESTLIKRSDLLDVALGCLPPFWRPWFQGTQDQKVYKTGEILETFNDQGGPYGYEFDPFFLAAFQEPAMTARKSGGHSLVVATGQEMFDKAIQADKPIWMFVFARWSYVVYYPATLDKWRVATFENKGIVAQSWQYIFFDEQIVSDQAELVFKNRTKESRTATHRRDLEKRVEKQTTPVEQPEQLDLI